MPSPTNPNSDRLRNHAIIKIQEARDAIKQYQAYGSLGDTKEHLQELSESASVMIKEAFAVGGSGKTCGRCGGSGREP